MLKLENLQVKFTACNRMILKHTSRPFVMYEIEAGWRGGDTWRFFKRYSDFYQLHQTLAKDLPSRAGLPAIPPKKLRGHLSPDFVETRSKKLHEYLVKLCRLRALRSNAALIDFLSVPAALRKQLPAAVATGETDEEEEGQVATVSSGAVGLVAKRVSARHASEVKVVNLLTALQGNSKCKAMKQFADWYFEAKPRLSDRFVKLLLIGEDGDVEEALPGLVQVCGALGRSKTASLMALRLLERLLDIERNKEAGAFRKVLLQLSQSQLRQLRLGLHILSDRGNRVPAFRVTALLRRHRHDLRGLADIVPDQWAAQRFLHWSRVRQHEGLVDQARSSSPASASAVRAPVLRLHVADDRGDEPSLRRVLSETRDVSLGTLERQAHKEARELAELRNGDFTSVPLPLQALEELQMSDASLHYLPPDQRRPYFSIRVQCTTPCRSASRVLSLAASSRALTHISKICQVELVRKLSQRSVLLHYKLDNFENELDVLVVSTLRLPGQGSVGPDGPGGPNGPNGQAQVQEGQEEQGGSIVWHSVELPHHAPSNRCVTLAGALFVQPVSQSPQLCRLTLVARPDTVLAGTMTHDLLGESALMLESMLALAHAA
ncbi:MAG: hypothetical protein MHM6MM_001398 [Cercozoa sp. M6MM]